MDLKSFLNLLLKNTPFVVMGRGEVNVSVNAGIGLLEHARWRPHWKIEKYHNQELFETDEFDGNLLLNEGITALLTLLIGGSATAFSSANAYIGVGDSAIAAAASQTGLQAVTNKTYKPMDPTYPQVSNQTVTFRATLGANDGNYAWNEYTICNSNSNSGINLSRKAESHGSKVQGDTWVISCSVTIS